MQSQDCANIVRYLEIGMQFPDSENVQRNLEIGLPLTLKGSPSKVISSSPRNFPSSRSSSYLLQGPREGSLVISEG